MTVKTSHSISSSDTFRLRKLVEALSALPISDFMYPSS